MKKCLWFWFLCLSHILFADQEPMSTHELIQYFKSLGLFTQSHQLRLSQGEKITLPNPGGSEGMAIFRVKAAEQKVWQTISNLTYYPNMIPELSQATTYKTNEMLPNNREKIYIYFQLYKRIMFIPITRNYYIIHNFPAHKMGFGTWETDMTQSNDLESQGFWRTRAVNRQETEVTYYTKLKLSGVDNWLKDHIIDQGLEQATQWVRQYSE